MKITTPTRVAPDDSHLLDAALFGDEDRFELSTIRPEDASIAMEMLIGNYASPMDAVIRELYVNASDSHRAAGQTRPVEITMPTEETPFLVVRDFGLGMSPADMVGVFTRPAASTKRSDNAATGGLGIGAKSPFTVADRFVVRGVKDGVAATLVMARIGGHLMHLVQEVTAVDETMPNGVEVTVPIESSKIDQWWRALSRVHFWWNAGGAVITNQDSADVSLPTWSERILQGMPAPEAPAVVHNPTLRSATVLMGQIGYAIPPAMGMGGTPVVYVLPVSAVSIAPTRESIVDTDENREILSAMLHVWQDEQFDELGARLMDPATSAMSLAAIRSDLVERGLDWHFDAWAQRTHPQEVKRGELPIARHLTNLGHDRSRSVPTRVHGIPSEAVARPQALENTLHMVGSSLPRIVFVDSRTLPESRRKVLTKWAREQNVVAVLVDRGELEQLRFSAVWSWSLPGSFTRPFAHPGEIEWVDAADIQVARAVRKDPAPAPTGRSTVEVIDMSTHRRERFTVRVDELVAHIRKRASRWAIVDTVAEISKIDVRLPRNIVAVPSGQRPAALLRSELGARAVTVAEFQAKQLEYVERSLTAAQKRTVADMTIARLSRVEHFFGRTTGWIDQTQDPEVRAVARKISRIVRAHDLNDPKVRQAIGSSDFRGALGSAVYDHAWLVKHASLGKFAPALMAAQSSGLSDHSWREAPAVIEHIRTTIATQLVKS